MSTPRPDRSPFAFVRNSYGVPAFRGSRVWWRGRAGRVTHASHYLHVRFDDGALPRTVRLHPCEDGLAYDRETPLHHRPNPADVDRCYGVLNS
jgi:hypothetical protein